MFFSSFFLYKLISSELKDLNTFYQKGDLAADFGIFTSPHTVLIDENSQEIGRIRGKAKWADKRMVVYIKSLMNNK